MLRKIVGIGLLVVGAVIFLVLLMSGGPIFPHVIGPLVLAVVGVLLLRYRSKSKEFRPN